MDIWDEVIKEYNDELDKLKNSVSNGQSDSFAHYKQMVGHIHGIEWSREIFTNVIKTRIYEEEE